MKTITQKNRQAGILIILMGCLLLFWVASVNAQKNTSEMSVDEALFIQGTVKLVSLEKKKITVKESKGERIKIQVDDQTDFVGISSFEELKKGQRIKVWYNAIGEVNIAEKIERMPDLGC